MPLTEPLEVPLTEPQDPWRCFQTQSTFASLTADTPLGTAARGGASLPLQEACRWGGEPHPQEILVLSKEQVESS